MPTDALTRRDRERLKTRNHLATVAIQLFGRGDFDAVTMEQIGAEADVAKGTLYTHSPIKEAVLAYAIHHELGRDLEPKMKRLAPDTGASGPNDIVDVYSFLIGNSQRAGELRKDLEPSHLAVVFQPLCLGALLRWLPAGKLKLRRLHRGAVEAFIHGAVPPAAAAPKRERKA